MEELVSERLRALSIARLSGDIRQFNLSGIEY